MLPYKTRFIQILYGAKLLLLKYMQNKHKLVRSDCTENHHNILAETCAQIRLYSILP